MATKVRNPAVCRYFDPLSARLPLLWTLESCLSGKADGERERYVIAFSHSSRCYHGDWAFLSLACGLCATQLFTGYFAPDTPGPAAALMPLCTWHITAHAKNLCKVHAPHGLTSKDQSSRHTLSFFFVDQPVSACG